MVISMDEVTLQKKRLKEKRHSKLNTNLPFKKTEIKKYINGLISRLLISVIVFFSCIIFINSNKQNRDLFNTQVLSNNISFTKITNWYNKYFGDVLPIKGFGKDTETVFNEKIIYSEIENYKDGFALKVEENYLLSSVSEGIVVFIGNKENYGNTVIVQGENEVDYWYGNVDNLSINLYDYINKGDLIGTTNGDTLYLVLQKDGEYLDYDEVFEEN